MKVNKLWAALLATTFGLAATATPVVVEAQAKKKAAAPAMTGPAVTKKPIALEPASLKWGMTTKQVGEAIDKQLDEAYKPLYQKVSPGVNQRALDAQLLEEKNTFRRSKIEFGKLPTAVDNSPLRGEYSYLNKEWMLSMTRDGKTRYFFFIQDKLWKIIDEIKLAKGGPLGANFQESAVKLSTTYGTPGRIIPPNPDLGMFATVVDWKDATTHVRLIERGETAIAIAYEDNATMQNIESLRPNKPKQEDAIDPAVAAAIRGPDPEPAPPPPADNKKKK
ncbi:hypothetical protein [Polyangium jinanense]|uniref:Uncharacterized protein n=1 Tax=Polyangium jinanense TaxID=2829994 RepID=A0A9X3X896_9BACT|nr:hypothetical protein [Polyangium jinanense]MDC3957675.1 hypothetical protein [Polyangium jinanense]MDC3984375.1 hypothetical protein [Polyangium jinanense]